MTHYTGMGPGTINHYRDVVGRMQGNSPYGGGNYLQPIHGHLHQAHPPVTPAFASYQHQPQSFGYNPLVNDQAGDFGRAFMRNLFR